VFNDDDRVALVAQAVDHFLVLQANDIVVLRGATDAVARLLK